MKPGIPRVVTSATMVLTTTNNTGSRIGQHYDWDLTLECGHRTDRRVQYFPSTSNYRVTRLASEARPAPRTIRCERCDPESCKCGHLNGQHFDEVGACNSCECETFRLSLPH